MQEGGIETSIHYSFLDNEWSVFIGFKKYHELININIQEDVKGTLEECLKHWNIGAMRRHFKAIMEEHVPARPTGD